MRGWHRKPMRRLAACATAGFTLVELVVVMTIIAILATAVTISVTNHIKVGRRTRALQDIATFETALDLYAVHNDSPPTTQQGLMALWEKPGGAPVPRNWTGPYLKKPPGHDPWGNEYVYRYPGQDNPSGYDMISYGEDGQPGGTSEWDQDITNLDVTE